MAVASPVIEFQSVSGNQNPGSISYDPRYGAGGGPGAIGTGDKAVGKGIAVDFLRGADTAYNSGLSVKCFDCRIDFQTGSAMLDRSAAGTQWSFNGGGSFVVT